MARRVLRILWLVAAAAFSSTNHISDHLTLQPPLMLPKLLLLATNLLPVAVVVSKVGSSRRDPN